MIDSAAAALPPVLVSAPIYLAVGLGAGIFYFAGLWWTVQRIGRVRRPALWTLASFMIRSAVVLTVFYAAADDRWERILICFVGFLLARWLVVRRMRPPMRRKAPARPSGDRRPADDMPES
jgi:F1F0 ATPase subunit 2